MKRIFNNCYVKVIVYLESNTMYNNNLTINKNEPVNNDLDYLTLDDDSSSIEYTRRVHNDSGIDLTVIEQGGLRYESKSGFVHTKNVIKITEKWSLPRSGEAKLRALLSSKEQTKNHPALVSMKKHFEEHGLRTSGERLVLAVTHEIDTDFFISSNNLFHQPTNLLFSKLPTDKAPNHPQSFLGEDRFLAQLDRFNNLSNVIGWQLELITNDLNCKYKRGIYIVNSELGLCHIKSMYSPLDKHGLYLKRKDGVDEVIEEHTLEELEESIKSSAFLGTVGRVFKSYTEAENHVVCLEKKTLDVSKDIDLRKAELAAKEWEARNKKLENDIALEKEKRESERSKHEADLAKLSMERTNNKEQSEQKRTDTTLKTVLTWATAMIGGVTLLSKLF